MACKKNMMSSAKNRWKILGAPRQTEMPVSDLDAILYISLRDSHSIHSKNKYGESGSPYSYQFDRSNALHNHLHPGYRKSQLNFHNLQKLHSTLSKALLISVFKDK